MCAPEVLVDVLIDIINPFTFLDMLAHKFKIFSTEKTLYNGLVGCSRNTYKLGLNDVRMCSSCPAHSHTVAVASSAHLQCVCDVGYTGAPGGPCTGLLLTLAFIYKLHLFTSSANLPSIFMMPICCLCYRNPVSSIAITN